MSLVVSRDVTPESVMLSPSISSNTFDELVIEADGARFWTLTFTEVSALAPSSSVTVAVIWRMPRVAQDMVIAVPCVSQSLTMLPSLSLSTIESVSQQTSNESRSDAVSLTSTVSVMLSSSNIGILDPRPEMVGATLFTLTIAVRTSDRAPSLSYAET